MMDIPKLRLLNQQLANPLFHAPKELVSWMGAAAGRAGGFQPVRRVCLQSGMAV